MAKCLEDSKFTRFPTLGERKSPQVKRIQKEQLHCSCTLPDHRGVDECDSCKVWYHRHCMDVPSKVFSGKNVSGSARNVNVCEDPFMRAT